MLLTLNKSMILRIIQFKILFCFLRNIVIAGLLSYLHHLKPNRDLDQNDTDYYFTNKEMSDRRKMAEEILKASFTAEDLS